MGLILNTQTIQEQTYYAALQLVERIDEDLRQGTRHYWTKAGKLLTRLDEVVRAILDGELLEVGDECKEAPGLPETFQRAN